MNKKAKKELIEWGLLISIAGILYFTGKHTEVIGQVQRVILATGIFEPEKFPTNNRMLADYNFKLRDANGTTVDFSNFKGKTIFLNFWATWCPPCIAEMPDIHNLYEKVHGDQMVFVMISQDRDFANALEFINRKEYQFPVYSLSSNLPKVYHSQSIPTTFIISPDGHIASKRMGMAKYDTKEFRDFLKTL